MRELTVVGIDLAYKRWRDVGSAVVSFIANDIPAWRDCRTEVIPWPSEQVTPGAMAAAIDRFAREAGASAVSIDGPQGWRNPRADSNQGVRRRCEAEVNPPGKTGIFGQVLPGNYLGWVIFSTTLFSDLLARTHVTLANDRATARLDPLPGGHYYLLECFPTSTWRTSGLPPLLGHSKAPPTVVRANAEMLRQHYGLPASALTDQHDQLQAIVAALPAAGLLGGPCRAVAWGEPAWVEAATDSTPAHLVEGLIWDAAPLLAGDEVPTLKRGSVAGRYRASVRGASGGRAPAMGALVATAPTEAARTCLCGCGGVPSGKNSRFLPGHDGRLKGELLRRARAGDLTAVEKLRHLGWDHFI